MPLSQGTKIGAYEILSLLGKGGMGEVYRAWDPRLHREIAIKVLSEPLLQKKEALARFEQEAKALASLTHANILTIYDIVTQHDVLFVVTELLKGETLRDRLKSGTTGWTEAVRIGIGIAEGLSAAHSNGIIHRDLKPENIFLGLNDQVKILDFGLARMEFRSADPAKSWMDTSPALSQPGVVMGTPQSMAPEQLRGQTVDARADIYALGCILYEMISGRLPFEGKEGVELTASILRDRPAGIVEVGVPQELIDLIFRCLEKDPELRIASARNLISVLRSIRFDEQAFPSKPLRRKVSTPGNSVAILPIMLEGTNPDDEYLMDGITESIINSLSQLAGLKVTARSTVFRYKGKDVDLRAAGITLGVKALMTGRGIRRGDRLEIQAELVNAEDGSQLWGQRFSSTLSDVFSVQEEIAGLISSALQHKLTGAERKMLRKRYTENPEAYHLYLKGRYYWNKRSTEAFEKAMRFFEQAIETDPTYALAYSGIADCYNFMGFEGHGISDPQIVFPRAISAASRALEIDRQLAEAHNSLAFAKLFFHYDWEGAETGFRRSIKLNPGYAPARVWYADFLAASARVEKALAQIRIAQNIDPLSPIVYAAHGMILGFCRDAPASRAAADRALELQPNFSSALFGLGRAFLHEGRSREAIDAMESAAFHSGNHPRMRANVALTYAASGRIADARNILYELETLSEKAYLPAFVDMALVYATLGEKDVAFRWLEQAYQARSSSLVFLYADPASDPLRSDPRFDELIRRTGPPISSGL